MKYLLILILCSTHAFAQTEVWEAKSIAAADVEAYPYGSGTIAPHMGIAFMLVMDAFIKAERASTVYPHRKFPLIIFGHGIGERTTETTITGEAITSQLSDLFATRPMSDLRYNTSALYNRTYRLPGEVTGTEHVIWAAPQCRGAWAAYFLGMYVKELIQWAYLNQDIIDINAIYYVGLSFGGGLGITSLQDPYIAARISAAIIIVNGFHNYPSFAFNDNYQTIIDNKIPVIFAHAHNDNATDGCTPGTNGGNACSAYDITNKAFLSDYSVRFLNSLKPQAPIVYFRYEDVSYAGGPHAAMWDWLLSPANWTTVRTLANGTQVTYNNPNPIEWLLQWKRKPRA